MDCAPARLGVQYIGWRAEVYQCPHDLVEAGTEEGDGNEGKEVGGGLGNCVRRRIHQLGECEDPSLMQDDFYLIFPENRISP